MDPSSYHPALMASRAMTRSSASSGNTDEDNSSISQIHNGHNNPSFHLTIQKLNNKNYLDWA